MEGRLVGNPANFGARSGSRYRGHVLQPVKTLSAPRRRAVCALTALVLGVALLAGCTGQRTPGGYGDTVEKNFLKGCTENAATETSVGDVPTYCQCVYTAISDEDDGLPFDEFKAINDDLVEKSGLLPKKMTAFTERCQAAND